MNEAQLINPQGTNKNMAARDKLEYWTKIYNEWVKYNGKVIYDDENVMVVEGKEEYLIVYFNYTIHITKDRILVMIGGRRYVATIPLRGRPRRGVALKTALRVVNMLPSNIAAYITSSLPLALVARG